MIDLERKLDQLRSRRSQTDDQHGGYNTLIPVEVPVTTYETDSMVTGLHR